jgi:NAD(P)-dependent dehydrogenase (short-subunit alcohol dehydrogenase family)
MTLQDRVAIVTGASRGIGKAIAIALARVGVQVIVASRTVHALDSIAGTLETTVGEIRRNNGKAHGIKTDVSKENSVSQLIDTTIDLCGRIDILVNNAATNFPALFSEMPQKHWDRIMEVNLRGTVLCTRAVLPHMIKQHWGHIINISSVVTQQLRHEPFTGIAYDITKVAVNRFTLGLSAELKRYNIAVNALMPDNTESEGWAYLNPDIDRSDWDRPETWGLYAALVAAQDPASFTGHLLLKKDIEALM